MQLYKEASRMLDKLIEDQTETDILVGIFEANSQNESIYIQKEGVSHIIPCLRQQVQKKEAKPAIIRFQISSCQQTPKRQITLESLQ